MSAIAGRPRGAGRRLAARGRRDASAPARRGTEDLATVALRLAGFAALAAFAAAHWARMVAGPPVAALALAVLLAAGLGVALTALGRAPLPRPAIHAAAAVTVLAFGALGLVAVGLDARLLAPGGWAELADELDRGIAGIRTVEWPYGGSEQSVREAILYAAPALLTLGAALAFWPARRGRAALRGAGLAAVLLLYGVAVTEHDPGEALLRGFALLALLAAWLWLPLLRGRQAAIGAGVVVAVGVLVLPFAAKLDSAEALVDYRSWDWVAGNADVSFDWEHSYGPLDWPRDGSTLLNVESERPLYWKAETLDGFDGLRWLRSSANEDTQPFAELPPEPDPRWQRSFDVTVRALRTDFVVVAGTPFELDGVGEQVLGSADGTVRSLDDPLRRGDSYSVEAYVPDPSSRRLRAAEVDYPQALTQYTRVGLPRRGQTALTDEDGRDELRSAAPAPRAVDAGLRDGTGLADPGVARAFDDSPYARTYALARRLVDGQPTVYDAVANVERHLERNYGYNERPPTQDYPLESFLFEDRIGYCQQFSGAMALMLRMTGIPTRVVSGFSPGVRNRDTGEYRVRDLDAHSWVEVYFSGIGWVTFDPTPTAAPAQRDSETLATDRGDRSGAALSDGASGGAGASERALDGATAGSPSQGEKEEEGVSAWALALVLGLLGLLALAALVWRGRARSPAGSTPGEQGLAELERALRGLGWSLPAGTTLLELEQRLGRAAGPTAAARAARLRSGRYARAAVPALDGGARRALRRELTAGQGLRARLRGLIALPPSLPRFRRG